MDRKKKTILVVDDEEDIVEFLSEMLKRDDYEVISSTKGKECIALAKNFHPDLIILDVMMPDMEGGQVAACLSEEPTTSNIPILFLTGAILTKQEEPQSRRIGKHLFMAKPTTEHELLEMVRRVLSC